MAGRVCSLHLTFVSCEEHLWRILRGFIFAYVFWNKLKNALKQLLKLNCLIFAYYLIGLRGSVSFIALPQRSTWKPWRKPPQACRTAPTDVSVAWTKTTPLILTICPAPHTEANVKSPARFVIPAPLPSTSQTLQAFSSNSSWPAHCRRSTQSLFATQLHCQSYVPA